jgi:predicted nuclease of restriction endonuclease-like (RecB) superfamily
MRVADKNAQTYYLKEAAENNWAVRTLDRNISTLYYQRLLSSQLKESVENEMMEKTEAFQNDKFDFIKNPSVLEFLNLPTNMSYTEAKPKRLCFCRTPTAHQNRNQRFLHRPRFLQFYT